MTLNAENTIRTKAITFTLLLVFLLLLLLFFLKWKLPTFEKEIPTSEVEVEVNWPPDPPAAYVEAGGGGGNEAVSPQESGVATATPSPTGETTTAPATTEDAKSTSAEIPVNKSPLRKSKQLVTSGLKNKPQKYIETPAPPRPKALMGKSTVGISQGASTTDEIEKTGGTGRGLGTGNGAGEGSGKLGGIGNGTGGGFGDGTGPRVTKGDRKIIKTYSFEGDLNRATLYVNILVSAEGVGRFVSFAKGSTTTGSPYRQAIVAYLEKMRFDKTDHESMVTVQFNFRIN